MALDAAHATYTLAYFGAVLIVGLAFEHMFGFARIPAFVNRIPVLIGAFTISAVSLRIMFAIAASAGIQLLEYGDEQGWIYNNQANVASVNGLLASNPALAVGLLLLTLAIAFTLGGVGGWLLAKVTLGLEPILILMVTLALTDVGCVFGRNITWLAGGTLGVNVPDPLAWTPGNQSIIWATATLALAAAVYLLLGAIEASPWGRLVAAVGENPVTASSEGKDIAKIRGAVVFYSSGIMALAGTLYSFLYLYVIESPYHNWPWLIYPIAAMAIGGFGNRRGVIIGTATIFAFLEAIIEFKNPLQGLVFFPVSYLESVGFSLLMLAGLFLHPKMLPRRRRNPIKGIEPEAS